MKILQEASLQQKFVWTHLATSRPLVAALLFLAAICPQNRATSCAVNCDQSERESCQLTAASTAPTILSQPGDHGLPLGDTAAFSVTVTGSLPLTYQWFFDNTATNDSLPLYK